MTDTNTDGPQLPDKLTVGEAADVLGVSRQRVRELMHLHRLDATKYGRNYLITRESLLLWVEKRRGQAADPPIYPPATLIV